MTPRPARSSPGFNLGVWFEHRLPTSATLERLVGWIATGKVATRGASAAVSAAAEAHRMLENGKTTGAGAEAMTTPTSSVDGTGGRRYRWLGAIGQRSCARCGQLDITPSC